MNIQLDFPLVLVLVGVALVLYSILGGRIRKIAVIELDAAPQDLERRQRFLILLLGLSLLIGGAAWKAFVVTPSPGQVAQATVTSAPSAQEILTLPPEPTWTVAPSPTSTPLASPTPTATPAPTATPTPTVTPTAIPIPTVRSSFGPVTFSSGFDEKAEKPVDVGLSFEYGITKLYAYWPYEGVGEGTPFRWDFYRDGSYFYGDYGTLDKTSGYNWQWIYLKSREPLAAGTYEFVVKVGEEVVLRDSCVVEEERKYGFGPITFAEGVTDDDQPINPTTTFPAGAKDVYAIFDYWGMEDGMEWGRTWYFEGEVDIPLKTDTWDGGERGTWWVHLSYESGDPLDSGSYRLELYIEGQVVQSGTFTIE